MSVVTQEGVGDFRSVPGKRCRCGRVGEWPGRLCPDCRPAVTPEPVEPDRLAELAAIANAEHKRVILKGQELIDHAIRCGQALIEARGRVEKGGWLDWMTRNLEMHITTAYRYMRIAEHRRQVLESGADTIEGAVQSVAELPRRGQGPRRYTQADKAEWQQIVDEIGVKRAARELGVAVSTLWKWTSPKSPDAGRKTVVRITDEMVDRLALWLVDTFGGESYPMRVTPQVLADAHRALELALAQEMVA